MTRVWEHNRPVTVRDVLEDLQRNRSIAYTTVMTVLDNLRQKGWVRRIQDGRAYRYEAVSTRASYAAALMHEAWAESDNPGAALVAFFGIMSSDQTSALRDALRVAGVPGVHSTGSGTGAENSGDDDSGGSSSVSGDSPEAVSSGRSHKGGAQGAAEPGAPASGPDRNDAGDQG